MDEPGAGWASVAVLAEPTRRRVFEAVRMSSVAMTRDDVAAAVGVRRPLAAFHLDRLVEAGLLHVSFARPVGRSGPGAGRPAKQYTADANVAVSVPPRRHDLVGRLLAHAVATRPDDAAREASAVAGREGNRIGALARPAKRLTTDTTVATMKSVLGELGYEPVEAGKSGLRLRNCPFHGVVDVAPALVCEMNVELIQGILDGLGGPRGVSAALNGAPGDCCVTIGRHSARRGRPSP